MNLENSKFLQSLLKLYYKRLFQIELIAIALIIISILIQEIKPEIAELIITVVAVTLSMLYFFLAFRNVENKNKWDDFYLKLNYFALSITCVGVVYILNHWPGSKTIVTTAIIALAIAVSTGLIEINFLKNGHTFQGKDIIRLFTAVTVVFVLYFASHTDLLRPEHEDFKEEFKQPDTHEALP